MHQAWTAKTQVCEVQHAESSWHMLACAQMSPQGGAPVMALVQTQVAITPSMELVRCALLPSKLAAPEACCPSVSIT